MIRLSRLASTGVHIEKLIFGPVVFLRKSIRLPAILDAADLELTRLRENGVEVILDQWDTESGDDLAKSMDRVHDRSFYRLLGASLPDRRSLKLKLEQAELF